MLSICIILDHGYNIYVIYYMSGVGCVFVRCLLKHHCILAMLLSCLVTDATNQLSS